MLSRREFFLGGASAFALVKSSPALAGFLRHGSAAVSTGFNGGKSTGQSTLPWQGDYPFVNLHNSTGSTWEIGFDSSFANGQELPPSLMDSNGFPTDVASVASDWSLPLTVPLSSSKAATALHPFVTTWEGQTTINISFINVTGGSGAPVFDSGSGKYFGRLEWYPNYVTDPRNGAINSANGLAIHIARNGITTGSYIANLKTFFKDYESTVTAGKYFSPQYVSVLQTAKFGRYRFMDWLLTNGSNVTTWASRKQLTYHSWDTDDYRPSLYGGITTNSGNDYTLSLPGSYVWTNPVQGNYTGGAPVDKMTVQFGFNADATFISNNERSSLTITSFSPLTFNWPSCPLANGNPVGLCRIPGVGGNFITGFSEGKNYYVVGLSGNTFNLAVTPGGSALSSTDTSSFNNNMVVVTPTLNIGTGGAIQIRSLSGVPLNSAGVMPTGGSLTGTVKRVFWATATFDADLNAWLMQGGSSGTGSAGISNWVPPEVCLQLCADIGMHPYFSIPAMTVDPMTDYPKSLMQMCKNGPSWMIPQFENGNEVWNNITVITNYAYSKSFAHWPTYSGGNSNADAWYGKALSTVGQDAAAVFGIGNLGVTYEVVCGGQYVPPGFKPNERIQSTTYVAQAAAPQSGYLKTAANPYVSSMLSAAYIYPSTRGFAAELQLAWQWGVTNVGNTTAQNANLNGFVDQLPALGAPNVPGNLVQYYLGTLQWGQAQTPPINKVQGYEGGWSPDLIAIAPTALGKQWQSTISAATKATQCVVTLPAYTSQDGPGGGSGNPAVVGMVIAFQGITTMTQLNTTSGSSINATFTSGSSIISSTNTLVAGQGIMFTDQAANGRPLPPGINPNTPYYVIASGLSGTQFQISLTKGGTALVADPTNIYTGTWVNCSYDAGWVVLGVSGNNVTLDVDSTGFTAFSGTNGLGYYLCSTPISNLFRVACLYAPDMLTYTTINYHNFTDQIGNNNGSPPQYELAGSGSVWPPIQPDIWGPQSQEFAAIAAWN
jgi:hypothetical protein